MSRTASPATARARASSSMPWRVRPARPGDAAGIAAAVAELLVELGATPPTEAEIRKTARALLGNAGIGDVFIAEAQGELIGVLGASWQVALHVPGCYGLIQDLWVSWGWRGKSVGAALLEALVARARELGVTRLEVGLPKDGYSRLDATEGFYRSSGFEPLGTRMRLVLG
jgi:GNAT superfamily N-acetyltransferase